MAYYRHNDLEVSNGNTKIGDDTLIFNITSATDCPSRARGMCQLSDPLKQCYAHKPEAFRPGCLAYRRRQAHYWARNTITQISRDFAELLLRFPSLKRVRFIRINEAGDFRNQGDVHKLNMIAADVNAHLVMVGRNALTWYGYSARYDLDFSSCPNILIKGSGHDTGNNGKTITVDPDLLFVNSGVTKGGYTEYDGKLCYICPGSCRTCSFCKEPTVNTTLIIPKH